MKLVIHVDIWKPLRTLRNYVKENGGIIRIDGRNYMSYEVVYSG